MIATATASWKFLVVSEETPLHDLKIRAGADGANVALVTDGSGSLSSISVRGLITKLHIANAVIEELGVFLN